ncbi:Hypothetical protein GSB_151286 [Giardia duodenalis]|uniref:Reverse transcriptase/endonuclease n=1 Tax=Giardia intestinalis TaxID=5741 RepID=V6TVX0_GIAIN|nr:Hypothetical protein GSB_151286 [Giardia intestinalis]
MPGFFHRGTRRVWPPSRQHGGARPGGPVRGGPALQERRTSTASSRTGCPTGATHCLQMCGLLTDEERAVKERHGSSWTTRHDMIVSCLYLRLSREFNAELEIKTHSHLHDQNQKPDIWLIDKCKTIDVGVTLPRQMDHYYNEKLKKYRDGTPDHLRDGSLHPVQAAPRSSTGTLKSSRFGPPCHRIHGREGQRASDG